MFRFIVPTILIGLSIAGFFMFASPLYQNITDLKAQAAAYNEALANSNSLLAERDKLTQTYNSMDPNNLNKLQKLLPDSVDNIRLILEIEKIASPYGMVLKDVKYNTDTSNPAAQTSGIIAAPLAITANSNKDYGAWDLEFSTQGSYSNFINLLKDLESNLRVVDVSSIQFSSDTGTGTGVTPSSSSSDSYKYGIKIKTYWLKS